MAASALRKRFRTIFFRIGRDLNDPEVLLQAHHTAWPVRWARGALADAVGHIDAGLVHYDEERHAHHRFCYLGHDPAVCGLAVASQLYSSLGYPTRAIDTGDRALTLARRLKHEPSLVFGLWFVVESQVTRRDVEGVISNTAELLKLAGQYGLPLPQAIGRVYRGWALASAGKAVEGLALAEEGISFLERSGGRIFLSRVYGTIAEIYLILGRYADGLRQLEKALGIASDIGKSFYLPRLFQIRARLIEASGHGRKTAVSSRMGRALTLSFLPCDDGAFAHLGRDAEAREAAARLLEVDPAFTISGYIARGGQSNAKLLIEGLRKAGVPE